MGGWRVAREAGEGRSRGVLKNGSVQVASAGVGALAPGGGRGSPWHLSDCSSGDVGRQNRDPPTKRAWMSLIKQGWGTPTAPCNTHP